MTSTIVPNRRIYISPTSGKVTLGFDCTWLWNFPEAVVALNARQVWDGFVDGQLATNEVGETVVNQLLALKSQVYGFNNLDISSLTARQHDIWIIESADMNILSNRILKLLQVLRELRDHPKLHQLIFTSWEIIMSAGALGQPHLETFWKVLAFLWNYRYRKASDQLLIHDFGLSNSTEVIIKLESYD